MAVEPQSCPTMSRGQYRYDFGDTTMLTPLIKMFTLGHSFVPPGIHAGGLRYHGMAPMVSHGVDLGLIEAAAHHQLECFEAAQLFAATEGIIAAPETSHAIRTAIDEAIRCREEGKEEAAGRGLGADGNPCGRAGHPLRKGGASLRRLEGRHRRHAVDFVGR